MIKSLPNNVGAAGDVGSIPVLERSPEEGNGNPLQYPSWKIPWTEEPGGLQSMGLQRVGHDRATKHTHLHIHCVYNYLHSIYIVLGIIVI